MLQVDECRNGMMLDESEAEESLSEWLLESEDAQKKAVQFVRDNAIQTGDNGHNMTIDDFHRWINDTLLKESAPGMTVSRSTAQRWLYKLGFQHKVAKKGVYIDGHDRPDVIDYRNNVFLPQMAEVEQRSYHYLTVDREVEKKIWKIIDIYTCNSRVDYRQLGFTTTAHNSTIL